MAQVKSERYLWKFTTLNGERTCPVERLLGSLPVNWGGRLSPNGNEEGVLDKPFSLFGSAGRGARETEHRGSALENTDHIESHSERSCMHWAQPQAQPQHRTRGAEAQNRLR